ncbi:Uncharacterised protein [Mycoplasmopsis maculosa]|uniref:Protein G-related albumin-binding (GA) module domain-containing protein n=1 Tax=Mycoplasmopsis maculosa TaxID=114885 RepID=A0A449B3Z6_9BACT|nr:GA module-containing protein [Mycoplasmopsis maculosa]VEU75258.1 Uncharacterised protein [Mycoplasmopsis maculosa]
MPYPGNDLNNDQNDSQNVINSLDSLNDNIYNLTDEEVRNKLSEINNLEAKINSLKTDAENIQDNTEKARINALIDQLININNSSDIELEIEKAKAKDEVNNLSNLSNDQKTSFNNRINLAVDSNAITSILEEAKLQNKKEALKLEVDSISYPNVDSTAVSNSKKTIKNAIENINSETDLTNKRAEIENIKEKMVIKKAEVENLGYKNPNALAKTSIKKGLDNITTLSDFNKVLPDDWSNKVNKYKEIIKKYFGDNSELMNNRFNKTYPDNLLGSPDNLNETNLKIQLFSTLKNEVSAYINSVNNFITPDEKSSLLQRLNAILEPSSATTPEQTEEILKQINDLHIEAKKTYFKGFINSLSVPNTTINGENMMDNFAKAKAEMIKTIVDPINSKNQFEATQRSLDSIATELTNVKRKINAFSANNQVAKDIFSLEMSKISTAQGYIDLATKIDKYNELIAKINNIPAFTSGGTQKQIAKANEGLDTLKNSLRSKLASASTIQDMQNLDSFLTKNVELVQSLRTTLSGDILVTKRLLEEASTKTDSASLTEIANRARELNTALQNNFWTPTKANELRGPLRDRWLMGPENVRFNIDDPDANLNNYFNYDDLVDKVLTRTTSADIRKITDVEIPKYKKLVETKSKAAEISSLIPSGANDSNPAKRAIESLKHIALTDATASDIETTNKYLGNVVRNQSGQVTSGFYKDAIDTLNSIGNDTNKSVFKGLLDNVATSLKDTNVKTNIDNLRIIINEFKLAYDSANTSLNNFRNSYGVTQQQIQEFQNRLNNVTSKEQADQLKNDIDAAINNANQRKQNDIRNTEAAINSLPNGNSERDRLTNLLNSEKVKPNVTPSDLENIKNQATNLKAQIDTALREANNAVRNLPDGNTLKTSLENKLLNAPNTQETNDLSKINTIKDQALAEARNLDAKYNEAIMILDSLQDKGDYKDRIDNAVNIAELDEIIRDMQTPKVLNKDEARKWANYISTTATASPVTRAQYIQRVENATTKAQLDQIIIDVRSYINQWPKADASARVNVLQYTHRNSYNRLKPIVDAEWDEDRLNELREEAQRISYSHPEF